VTAPNVVLRLNRGERPEPLPVVVFKELQHTLANYATGVQQYPSYQAFYERLSQHTGFPTNQIVVGAGIEEFIRTLMFLCCDPGQKAAVLWPTCAMYDIYAAAFGVDLVRIKPRPGELFAVADILKQLPPTTRVLFLPNPGQPVETVFSLEELGFLAEQCQHFNIILAVDEAHHGFGADTAFPLVDAYENVLVMRTFSKFFGAASIRVGYVVGPPSLIKFIDAARPSGEIAGPSMAAATVLLDHHSFMVREARDIASTRDWLRHKISELGVRVWGSAGFSLLVEFRSRAEAETVATTLALRGVYVKSGFPLPVEKCIMLACGKLPMMQRFFTEFEGALRLAQAMEDDCVAR
jgi:histidinol-phosphate/aromatic aminotransferase/cobyric acid decarboxylase-like protein